MLETKNINNDFIRLLSICVDQEKLNSPVIQNDFNLFKEALLLKIYISQYVKVNFNDNLIEDLFEYFDKEHFCDKAMDTARNIEQQTKNENFYSIIKLLLEMEQQYFEKYIICLKNHLQTFFNTNLKVSFKLVQLYLEFCQMSNSELNITLSHLINEMILIILKTDDETMRRDLIYRTLPIYYKLNKRVDVLCEMIWEYIKNTENLVTLSSIEFMLIPEKWNKSAFTILETVEFWNLLQKYVTNQNGFNQKIAVCLLKRSYMTVATSEENIYLFDGLINYKVNRKESFLKTFSKLCDILEILREKQLHLIQPVLNNLQDIEDVHPSWLICINKLMLTHTQNVVKYFAIEKILRMSWFIADDNYLKEVLNMLFLSINNGEYSTPAQEAYAKFRSIFTADNLPAIIKTMLTIKWHHISLYCLYNAMYSNEFNIVLPIYLIERLVNQVNSLAHMDSKRGCFKILSNFISKSASNLNQSNYMKVFSLLLNVKCKRQLDYPNSVYLEDNVYFPENSWDVHLRLFIENTRCVNKTYGKQLLENILTTQLDDVIDDAKLELCLMLNYYYEENYITDALTSQLLKVTARNETTDKLFLVFIRKLTKLELENYISERFFSIKIHDDLNPIKLLYIRSKIDIQSKHSLIRDASRKILDKIEDFNENQIGISLFFLSKTTDFKLTASCIHFLMNFKLTKNVELPTAFLKLYIKSAPVPDYPSLHNYLINTMDLLHNMSYMYNVIKFVDKIQEYLQEDHYLNILKQYLKQFGNFTTKQSGYLLELYLEIYMKGKHFNKIEAESLLEVVQKKCFEQSKCFIKIEVNNQIVLPYLLSCLLFKDTIKKQERYEYEVLSTMRKMHGGYFTHNEYLLRHSIHQILKLSSSSNYTLINELIIMLIENYKESFNKRYFPNAQLFMEKMRTIQALLIICKNCSDNMKEVISKFALDCLCNESHQNCVKQLLQWLIILLNGNKVNELLLFVKKMLITNIKTHTSTIITFCPILYHLIKNKDESYYENFFTILLPHTMGPHFKLRLHAQFLISKLYKKGKELGYKNLIQKWYGIYDIIQTVINSTEQLAKQNELIKEDFLDNFDPHLHYSLEIIFSFLPKVHNVLQTELDLDYIEFYKDDITSIPIRSEVLPIYEYFNQLNATKQTMCASCDTEENAKDIQKKIVPMKEFNADDIKKSQLIVVATLIDSLANLGGLTRTSEIFNIYQLIVNNSKIVSDKEFKSLSLSAEKWIDITEIKEKDLIRYLYDLKSDGYTLIGLEQTSNSEELGRYKFPAKSLLLLGNEKEGIPTRYISLLDVCLQIPQFGLVRSLNVHVAGSVCIWEYTKQHVIQ